jgi:hypothetical protein
MGLNYSHLEIRDAKQEVNWGGGDDSLGVPF